VTFKHELELDSVTMNQSAKYLDQRWFRSKGIVQAHRYTHTGPTALPGLLTWLANTTTN